MTFRVWSADRDGFSALQKVNGYDPKNTDFSVANGQTALGGMQSAQDTEVQDQATADNSRDDAVAAEWDFHNFMLGAKEQVIAQFTNDSNEIQSIGLKKKSEYRKPVRKAKAAKTA